MFLKAWHNDGSFFYFFTADMQDKGECDCNIILFLSWYLTKEIFWKIIHFVANKIAFKILWICIAGYILRITSVMFTNENNFINCRIKPRGKDLLKIKNEDTKTAPTEVALVYLLLSLDKSLPIWRKMEHYGTPVLPVK